MKEFLSVDGVDFYTIDYTYVYNGDNTPSTKTGQFVIRKRVRRSEKLPEVFCRATLKDLLCLLEYLVVIAQINEESKTISCFLNNNSGYKLY